ncbi:protein FAR1-RELATED SEQUENCE 6-like [Nymphaea colorata]|nr:protein FAR1-RELATED SEQUENCE 6-like [Nymphaea colorata]
MECDEMDQIIVEEGENAPCLSGLESHMEEAEGMEPHIDEAAKDATMDLNMVEGTKSTNMNPSADQTAVGNMNDDPASKELVTAGEDATMEPVLGMSFDSYAEAEKFYYDYAKHVGFGTRIKSTSRSKKTKEINHVVICCNKEGFKAPKRFTAYSKPITRIGCDAMVRVKQNSSKKWVVTELHLPHNHVCYPNMARRYKSHHHYLDSGGKKFKMRGKKDQKSGKKANQSVNTLFIAPRFYPQFPFVQQVLMQQQQLAFAQQHQPQQQQMMFGQQESLPSEQQGPRHLKLGKGDLEMVHLFFERMQLKNKCFHYMVDVDSEGKLRNVFWADAKSRAAFEYFGDVIMLDTTSLVSRYDLPLVTFVGANHHGQSVLLGCGLLADESVESFTWLLKSWVECMSGRFPNAIVTDECQAIQAAVGEVFPKAHHRLCLWHIMEKIPTKLRGLSDYKAIKKALKKAVYDSLRSDEFERSWKEVIDTYKLEDNQWLSSLYELRHQWAPVFIKDIFYAGMSTSRRGEKFNAFFDGYVYSNTSFKEFAEKYEMVLKKKYNEEAQADFDSYNKVPVMRTHLCYESQLAKVYSGEIFVLFQEEVYGTFDCYNIERTKIDGHCSTYILKERVFDKDGNIVGSKEFEVMASEPAAEVQCLCRLFQYKGFLCRHALYVLNHIGVHEIPNHYILPRWRKDFKRIHALQNHSDIVVPISEAQRYDNLYQMFIHLVEEGSLSVDHYKVAVRGIAELVEKILYGAESHNGFVGNYTDNSIDGNQYNEVNLTFTPMMNSCVMNDPLRVSWPFHLDDGIYGSVETNTSNKKRCSKCGKLGHNKKTCKEVTESPLSEGFLSQG